MRRPRAAGRALVGVVVLLSAAFVAGGLVVRGRRPPRAVAPEDRPGADAPVREALQLLQAGAAHRIEELDELVRPELGGAWRAERAIVFGLVGCPRLAEWLAGAEGLRLERLLAELTAGTREEALAALALTVELARHTRWSPDGRRGSPDAVRLAGLLEGWLDRWAEFSAEDPLLHEPALAAAILYGRVMRAAIEAPRLSRDAAAAERARAALDRWLGEGRSARTEFGEAFRARFARAASLYAGGGSDALLGFEEEAAVLFPLLDGECGER